jgi:hypothetical protein
LVIAEPEFDASAKPIGQLEARLRLGHPHDVLDEVKRLDGFWRLCPRLHFVEARAWELLGDADRIARSVANMQNCLRGPLSTGEGAQDRPFLITFLTDERDVLRVIGEDFRCQRLLQRDRRVCDVVTSHAGQDIWFDVTDLVPRHAVPQELLECRGV